VVLKKPLERNGNPSEALLSNPSGGMFSCPSQEGYSCAES